MSANQRTNVLVLLLLLAVGGYALNLYLKPAEVPPLYPPLERLDIENKVHSLRVLTADNRSITVQADFQVNGESMAQGLRLDTETFPSYDHLKLSFLVRVKKSGRQQETVTLRPSGIANEEDYLVTGIRASVVNIGDFRDMGSIDLAGQWPISSDPGYISSVDAKPSVEAIGALLDGSTTRTQRARAKKMIDAMIIEDPKNVQVLVELARYQLRNVEGEEEAFKAAERVLLDALAIDDKHANAHVVLGYVYTHQDRFAEAMAEFETAEKLGTNNLWLPTNIGELQVLSGNPAAAETKLRQVLDAGRSNSRSDFALRAAYRHYLRALRTQEKFAEMEEILQHRIDTFPEHGSYYAEFVEYLTQHQPERADIVELALKAKELECCEPGQAERAMAKAFLLRSLFGGQVAGANSAEDLTRARSLQPNLARTVGEISNGPQAQKFLDSLRAKHAIGVDDADADGGTALAHCVSRMLERCVKNLVAAGSDVNQEHQQAGITVLAMAVSLENKAIVDELLAAGADPRRTGKAGISALQVAEMSGREELVRLLSTRRMNLWDPLESTCRHASLSIL